MKPGPVSRGHRVVAVVDGVVMVVEGATAADAVMVGKGAATKTDIRRCLVEGPGTNFSENPSRTAAIGSACEFPFDDNRTKGKELCNLWLTNQTHKKERERNHRRISRSREFQSKRLAL